MTTEKTDAPGGASGDGHHVHSGVVALDAVAGAAAGAVAGVLAGPVGIVAGAILGGAIGAAAGEVLQLDQIDRDRKDEQLDRDIGVTEGNLGEASPDQPPAVVGRFHAASMGVGSDSGGTPSEGMMQNLDGD